jgi:asparagine synthase (glutamine-hydrolysing)
MAKPAVLKVFFGFRLEDTLKPYYSHLIRWNNNGHLNSFLLPNEADEIRDYDPITEIEKNLPTGFDQWNWLSKAQWLESTILMSGYLLSSQGDRMSLANSVEGRYPFLDYRLIEFCSNLPDELKLNGLNEKYLLKKLMNNKLPVSVLKRPKQPYRAPVSQLFINEEAPEYIKYLLSDHYIKQTGIFNNNIVSRFIEKLKGTSAMNEMESMFLPAIVSTQILYNQFIEKEQSYTVRRKQGKFHVIDESK